MADERGEYAESAAGTQVAAGDRFAFGRNWRRYLALVNENRVRSGEESLKRTLGVESLAGWRFLDAGCGSGLFSLCARRLGASVVSFDFDTESVQCAHSLREQYGYASDDWEIFHGSVLDREFLETLGRFDVVYSWGVLHHTGRLWEALDNVSERVDDGGCFFLSIYNDQGWLSTFWLSVKILYNRHRWLRPFLIAFFSPYFILGRYVVRRLTGRASLERGMSLWYDMLDWLGGLPFETAKPEEVFERCRWHGFDLFGLRTCGGRSGCNEFVFRKRTDRLDSPAGRC